MKVIIVSRFQLPINNDNDGIPDYADANIDGDSKVDPGKLILTVMEFLT